jgi:SAM-dependent methyltransferase
MNWLSKALTFKILSHVPAGRACYRFLQDHLTKSLTATRERVLQKAEVGLSYWQSLERHAESPDRLQTHLDLGSGWHPTIPLLFEGLGVRRQLLCDVSPVMTPVTFESTRTVFRTLVEEGYCPECHLPPMENDERETACGDISEMMSRHGMTYHAPYFGIGDRHEGEIDFITCTQVLLYIGMPHLLACFQEMHRSLRPGGWFLATNHLYDLYADADKSISSYNNLRYSNRFWNSVVNSGMMSFNRYKSRDYRDALEQAGFEIVEFDITPGQPGDLERLRSVNVHPEFTARYTEEELLEKHLYFIARKP